MTVFSVKVGDFRGSVTTNTYSNSSQIEFYKYDDFGKLIAASVYINANPYYEYRYLGKHGVTMEQWQLGHYNVKARHYDASIGRFLSEDPIWSTNLYPYSENNPVCKVDPSGEIVETMLDAASVGVSGYELYSDPSLANAGYFMWDLFATFIPYVPGSWIRRVDDIAGNLVPLGKVSTGRHIATSTAERDAMITILSNPTLGRVIIPSLGDRRLKGWSKLRYEYYDGKGNKVVIHYVAKIIEGVIVAIDDFKFK